MTMLLEVNDLHFSYPSAATPVLRGVSLALEAGEKVALIGSNGSGKSTLLLHCNGILRPEQGHVRVAGQPMGYAQRDLRAWRRQVGLVFQHPDDQLFSASVAQDISFGPLNLGLSEPLARQCVADAAELCGVTHLLERPTHALSGGEKARVALAGVLAMQPRIVLADEALSTLDPWIRLQVLAIFERLVAQSTSILLATHDLYIVRTWAERVIVMRAGQVIADAPPTQLFSDPLLLAHTGLDAVVNGISPTTGTIEGRPHA